MIGTRAGRAHQCVRAPSELADAEEPPLECGLIAISSVSTSTTPARSMAVRSGDVNAIGPTASEWARGCAERLGGEAFNGPFDTQGVLHGPMRAGGWDTHESTVNLTVRQVAR